MLVSKVSQLPSAIMTKSLLFLVFSALSVQACLSYEVTGKKSKSAWKKCHKGFFCRDLSNEMQHYCWSTLCFSIQRQPSEAFHIVWKSPKMSNCVFFAPKFKYIAEKLVIEILFFNETFLVIFIQSDSSCRRPCIFLLSNFFLSSSRALRSTSV